MPPKTVKGQKAKQKSQEEGREELLQAVVCGAHRIVSSCSDSDPVRSSPTLSISVLHRSPVSGQGYDCNIKLPKVPC